MNQSIIVYRSKSEEAMDDFWYSIGFPWLYDHKFLVFLAMVLIVGIVLYINRKGKR